MPDSSIPSVGDQSRYPLTQTEKLNGNSSPQALTDAGANYKAAGVDIDAGEALVRRIAPAAARTAQPGADARLGGFGGLFDLRAAGFRDPVLVAAADGVGTKLEIAQTLGRHRGVGVDLVAMCLNDLVAQGAKPLFFLDHFATGTLDADAAAAVVEGIADGCVDADCALIGGETAEMPGFYPAGRYDLAGFAVGAFERERLEQPGAQPGDVVLGLASDGLHANGFSLVRRIVEQEGLDLSGPSPFSEGALGDALLAPTRIYVRPVLAALAEGGVRALAHITGGGLVENPPRSLPPGLAMRIDCAAWPLPPVFEWLAGHVAPEELARTFNCGIGMTVAVVPSRAEGLIASFKASGETVFPIGKVVEGDGVKLDRLDDWRCRAIRHGKGGSPIPEGQDYSFSWGQSEPPKIPANIESTDHNRQPMIATVDP